MEFSITGPYPPGIFTSPTTGKTYAVSGSNWVEVPSDFTIPQAHDGWKGWEETKSDQIKTDKITYTVQSSSGKGTYTVTYENKWWNCTCPGFGFRKRCNHIDNLKKQMGIK